MHATARRLIVSLAFTFALSPLAPARAQAPAAAPAEPVSAKTWGEKRKEIEDFLKVAEVLSLEELKIGVTKPKRAQLAPGGPVARMAWKDIQPGFYSGYRESYKSEVAAYELDKLLELNMVPPTVERKVKGGSGAAVMWCAPVKNFNETGGVPTPPAPYLAEWTRQLIRTKMFDNLIGNLDPNLGNWLVDPAWNLILIDHTRAFTMDKSLVHSKMGQMDAELWGRMKALTIESLTAAIGEWVGKGEIKAILDRRARMEKAFGHLLPGTDAKKP